jgi:small subunit ribosomal protein S6
MSSLWAVFNNSLLFKKLLNPKGDCMRHYEVIFLVHPNQSAQVPGMIERYSKFITERNGKVHRVEDLGRRQLAYIIDNIRKAHYVLFNIECDGAALRDLEDNFRYNDIILRNLIVRKDEAETGKSKLLLDAENKEKRQAENNNKYANNEAKAEEASTPTQAE